MKPTKRRLALKSLLRVIKMSSGDTHDAPSAPFALAPSPLHAELLSADQMVQHAKALAALHVLEPNDKRDRLLVRLAENSRVLSQACEALAKHTGEKSAATPELDGPASKQFSISPAAEWLLDNFYLIEEQILTATAHLPKGYSRELPQLHEGGSRGLPRIYDLALAVISHSDCRLDLIVLERFVDAYQQVTPLALGELWAFPIMLRLALIDHLTSVAVRTRLDQEHLLEASQWAQLMFDAVEQDPKSLIGVIADMARSDPPLVSAFVAELARRLRGHGPALALGLSWIEQTLAESNLTIEHMVLSGNQRQAADQVSISNSIGSLRFLGATDWQVFVERLSHVEQLLAQDRYGTYKAMDFATRDRYRHVIDRLAKSSRNTEIEVTHAALALAQKPVSEGVSNGVEATRPQDHVGYFLIGPGLAELEQKIGAGVGLRMRIARAMARFPLALHLTAALSLSMLFIAVLLHEARIDGAYSGWIVVLAPLCLLGVSQLSLSLANLFAALLTTPNALPRMDFSQTKRANEVAHREPGIPVALKTLVVIPTMLSGLDAIEALLSDLEVRYLGNQDANLYFALLTDFTDAPQATLASDAPLLTLAQAGIEQLNRKYRKHSYGNSPQVYSVLAPADRFFLMHRSRRWNPSEGVWMGYERKRGKLSALNGLLRGGQHDFALIVGNLAALDRVKYVITLDTDTELPRDSAHQMIGAMAHPLNQPQFDTNRNRVIHGYGILQPGMAASLSGGSLYAALCSNEPGIDPYTRSVSDVYQDLYGEGSFIGKGIYDIEVFERAVHLRFPENRILSHDLLEGCYARSGLISDVQLHEQHPTSYLVDMARHERWIRGDWQIGHWCLSRVPAADGKGLVPNPLSLLSRGKIADNLRRSMVPAALLLILLIGVGAIKQPLFWISCVLVSMLLPAMLGSFVSALRWPANASPLRHLREIARSTTQSLYLLGFRIACLPYEAYVSTAAIGQACWRMRISRRNLLVWRTPSGGASHSSASTLGTILRTYRKMWAAPVAAFSLVALGYDSLGTLGQSSVTALLAGAWLCAPALAWWLSKAKSAKPAKLTAEQHIFLRKIARKSWAFFERLVNANEHYLPPDNFQLHPGPLLAHRTSPTNIGLALLANVSAYDFGFISATTLLQRCDNTLATLLQLPRFQGHFYNWYDTTTLTTLAPRYVSTVDSGNLAGHLLTLRGALQELPDAPLVSHRTISGISDSFSVVLDATPELQRGRLKPLQALLRTAPSQTPEAILDRLRQLAAASAVLMAEIDLVREPNAGEWSSALNRQILDALYEIEQLMPWLSLAPPLLKSPAGSTSIASVAVFSTLDKIHVALANANNLRAIAALPVRLLPWLDVLALEMTAAIDPPHSHAWLLHLHGLVSDAGARARDQINKALALAKVCDQLCVVDYEFLYDPARKLLAIGYNVDSQQRDSGFYDLLASEARLGYFVAIACGQIPQESWFALGRLRTNVGGAPILMSWSGSMFEYLMPLLVMPSFSTSLLEESMYAAVSRQIAFGRERALPWGVSESGYSKLDLNLNYQYHAFGVPGLGLKRGLAVDSVVAPYACALALMVQPEAACANLQRLSANGIEGNFGFFEAVDFTPARIARGQSSVVVRSFMAHHQGMSLLSIAHLLLDQPMQRRFVADQRVQATVLLLQERVPKNPVFHKRLNDNAAAQFLDAQSNLNVAAMGAHTAHPHVQLLSNGRYHVMLTNAGSGYTRVHSIADAVAPIAITRWREDKSCDHWGSFFYIRDQDSGEFWSAAHQPSCKRADSYEAIFSEGRAEYRRRDFNIDCATEIVVSPEDDVEVRRITLSNRGDSTRRIEVTSYQEVVLAPVMAELMQPAFSNLFVQSEISRPHRAVLCTRRPRSPNEPGAWMFHLLASNGDPISDVSFETDRMRFIGRGRGLRTPQALCEALHHAARRLGTEAIALSNTEGSVLDPIAAIRCTLTLKPGQSVSIDFVSGVSASRDACMHLVQRYQDRHHADRVFDLAWTHASVGLRQLDVSELDAQLYRQFAGHILYASTTLRADAAVLVQNRRGQSGLWGYAISGDLPIVLLKIADSSNIALAQDVIQCHSYMRHKGLLVDLVIWNEDHAGYRQRLQDQIIGLIASGVDAHVMDRPGGVFVRRGEQISPEDRILLQAVARVIIDDSAGTLAEQVNRRAVRTRRVARLHSRLRPGLINTSGALPLAGSEPPLLLDNGIGGFNSDASEYIIRSSAALNPPLPWVNVLANAEFGTVITERGMSYTWSENAHEFRLSPWSDDPVGASSGEALYLRDEHSGDYWSPTPAPCDSASPYTTRHGFGYSVFEHQEQGLHTELTVYVDLSEAIKFSVLKVGNRSGRTRQLSATGFVEWVLGDLKANTGMHVVTEIDALTGAIFARNHYNTEFSGRVAFFDVDESSIPSTIPTLRRTNSADRTEFLGRNGSLAKPAALARAHLSGRVGAALDPCAAIQVAFELADGAERQIVFRLGAANQLEQARAMNLRLRKKGTAQRVLANVRHYWQQQLHAVQVKTPDPAFDALANGWLVYQTLSCRFFARSGFYQSGGAYGFRDQLQDAMALLHVEPALVRAHLLRAAARQYPEGDVQHWWHPPTGRGVRTRCSDDYLWLALACCRYVTHTGDATVLDEQVSFLSGRALAVDEESYYDLPVSGPDTASLYEHCVRAINNGLRFGAHGLPLIGSGDWNDGMNLVGQHGKGESIWLGFFLYRVLGDFAELSQSRGDSAFATRCLANAEQLRENLEANGWDGAWYRRAYFDDGTPLGSQNNHECSIDSIAQSWSVLSGAGMNARVQSAMNALDERLVRRKDKLIALLDPAFGSASAELSSESAHPGYIAGYVPGVRENGGQYTHAAIWAVMAFVKLGDHKRAWELFNLINPLNHANSAEAIAIYKAEPYVVAADVYAVAPHIGRGGWSWYTGSAGWMYRLMLESLLGLIRTGDQLRIEPCLPDCWNSYDIRYRFGATHYLITVRRCALSDWSAVHPRYTLDGRVLRTEAITLIDDGHEHIVEVDVFMRFEPPQSE